VPATLTPELAAALAQAEAIIDRGIDAVPAGKRARPVIRTHLDWLSKQESPSSSRKGAQTVIDCGPTKEFWLEDAEILDTYNDGAHKRITNRSIARYLIALALLSHPIDAPPTKIRRPTMRFQKRPRPRTEAELRGLREGNERRHEEAQQRKEAKVAARV
jgi:hypothetical protein